MTPLRLAAGAAGVALCGMLAGCGSGTSTTGYSPITAPGSAAPADPAQAPAGTAQPPAGAVQAPGRVVPAGSAPAKVVPGQQAPTDYTLLARRFVTLRNQGTQALATVKDQASSSDLEADKKLMAFAAGVYANYVQGLRALPLPATMKNDANALVNILTSEQGTFVQASQVTTFDQLNPLLQTLVDDQDDQLVATNALERDLALPMSTPKP